MSGQDSVTDLDISIQWKSFTSKDGVPFEIGVRQSPASDTTGLVANPESGDSIKAADSTAKVLAGDPFDIKVHWVFGGKWVNTSEEENKVTAVSQYRLGRSSSIMFKYVFDFTSSWTYNYTFYDESGDEYTINTIVTGDHYFRYNSDAPTIVRVAGY